MFRPGETATVTGAEPSPAEADPEAAAPAATDTGEARLLQELFAGTEGLHSALDHSAVEETGGAERRDVERRAAAVAQQAAAAVAASRAARQQAGVHMCGPPAVRHGTQCSDTCPTHSQAATPVLSLWRSAAPAAMWPMPLYIFLYCQKLSHQPSRREQVWCFSLGCPPNPRCCCKDVPGVVPDDDH